jgi:hypothetical protein
MLFSNKITIFGRKIFVFIVVSFKKGVFFFIKKRIFALSIAR